MSNLVQGYLEELNKLKVPENETSILDFLGSLQQNQFQQNYLSFILSQSHIFDSMETILNTYTHKDFYHNAGYNDRQGNIVPKLDKDGKICYKEYVSCDSIDDSCKTILKSLQSGDKNAWELFVKYVKSIYEPSKMNIYHDSKWSQLSQDILFDFNSLRFDISDNDRLRAEIDEQKNKPIVQENGFFNRIKGFFSKIKRDHTIKKAESTLQDDNAFTQKAVSLIGKYKENTDMPTIIRDQLEFGENLIKAGLPKDIFLNVLNGIARSPEAFSHCNYRIFDMLKHLSINATIAKQLYSPEIIYAESFQDMTKNIRKLLARNDLKEDAPITTEYRSLPLKNALLATEDISTVLKGANLSKEQIQSKMDEYDTEFKDILEEQDPETYVRRCTSLTMKFISTHPFDDGNGRTSRMLLQTMLARRGIFFPSNIDNYFERQSGTDYSVMEKTCLKTEDYTPMCNYIVERAKAFNNGELIFNDTPLTFIGKDRNHAIEQDIPAIEEV